MNEKRVNRCRGVVTNDQRCQNRGVGGPEKQSTRVITWLLLVRHSAYRRHDLYPGSITEQEKQMLYEKGEGRKSERTRPRVPKIVSVADAVVVVLKLL